MTAVMVKAPLMFFVQCTRLAEGHQAISNCLGVRLEDTSSLFSGLSRMGRWEPHGRVL